MLSHAARLPLAAGEEQIEAWMLEVADVDCAQLDTSALDAGELRRAQAFVHERDRVVYAASHLLLRALLAERLGVRPDQISFRRERCPICGGVNGRPVLAAPGTRLHFSLSRSSGIVLVALALQRVGVDIQAISDAATADEVATLLHPAELREIASAPRQERPLVFTRIWTRKEAYLKAIGTGVAHELAATYVGTGEPGALPRGWLVIEPRVPEGFAAALALHTSGSDLAHKR